MISAVTLLLLAHVATAHAAPAEPDCANTVTQQAMNICAARDFDVADAELNAQWRITASELRQQDEATAAYRDDRPSYFEQLLIAQRAWLAFRDAHCVSEGYGARGGSMEPMLVASCRAALTRARTQQLRDLLQP